jgi:hypothetical protein
MALGFLIYRDEGSGSLMGQAVIRLFFKESPQYISLFPFPTQCLHCFPLGKSVKTSLATLFFLEIFILKNNGFSLRNTINRFTWILNVKHSKN